MIELLIFNGDFFGTEAAIAIFGKHPIRECRKNESVRRADCTEPTVCKTYGGDTVAMPDTHFLAYVVGGNGEPRPVEKSAWSRQYVPSPENDGTWVPTGRRIVQVPEGVICKLETIEADKDDPSKRAIQTVQFPDFVAVGNGNEVYTNGAKFVKDSLIPTDGRGPLDCRDLEKEAELTEAC